MALKLTSAGGAYSKQLALVSGDVKQASANQSIVQSALTVGGQIELGDSGVYHLTADAFYPTAGTRILLGPDVQFSINGVIGDPPTLSPVIVRQNNGRPSYRTVLFGDSMTSQYYVDNTPNASYDPTTGLLTITSLSNPVASGWTGMVFNRTYAALKKHINVEFTFVSSTSVTCYIGKNLDGLPTGALSGTTFLRSPTKTGANSWVTWLQSALGWPFDVVYNGAQSGDTTADCLARINDQCLAYSPAVVLMQMPGINDMSAGNGPIDEETIFKNQKEIIERILASGASMVILGVTPVGTGESRATLQNMSRVVSLNRRLQSYLKGRSRCVFIDSYAQIVNPSDTTGLATAGLLKSTDQIHYAIPGAVKVADAVYSRVSSLFPAQLDQRPRSTIDCFANSAATASSVTVDGGVATFNSTAHGFLQGERVRVKGATPTEINGWKTALSATANAFTFATTSSSAVTGTITASRSRSIFANPVLATASGGTVSLGVSGTAASLLSVKNTSGSAGGLTAVASVVADTYGNKQRLVCSAASLDDRPGFETSVTSIFNSDFEAGREYSFEGVLAISSANWANTPISEIMVRLMVNVDSTLFSTFALNTYDGLPATGSLTADRTIHFKTAPMKIPAGTISQGYFQVYVRAAGTWSSNLTIDLSRIAVLDVTQ